MYSNQVLLLKRISVILISLFIATGVLAEDAADDEDAAKDTTSKTGDAAAGPQPTSLHMKNIQTTTLSTQAINPAVGFYYTLNNKGRDNVFGVKFTATFIKPTWLVH